MRLIDADALRKHIDETHPYSGLPMAALICTKELLQYAPTVDAEPVAHAHWERVAYMDGMYDRNYSCSRCGRLTSVYDGIDIYHTKPYCHCGARMDEEVDDEHH